MIYNQEMRTIITLTKEQVKFLKNLQSREKGKVSRAELIRRALDFYSKSIKTNIPKNEVFGLWKKRKVDALKYEDQLRDEWQ